MKAEVQTKCSQDQEELKRSIQEEINQKNIKIEDLDKKLKEKEKEMIDIIDKHNEEVKTKDVILEGLNTQEIKLVILNHVYSKTMGSKVEFTNDSELKIDLSNDKGELIMNIYITGEIFNIFSTNYFFVFLLAQRIKLFKKSYDVTICSITYSNKFK